VNETLDILSSISSRTIEEKRGNLSKVWKSFLYFDPPESDDAFSFIIKSLQSKMRPFSLLGRKEYH